MSDQKGPVVVGVDGSENAGAALCVAAELARALHTELLVVHAVGLTTRIGGEFAPAEGREDAIEHDLHTAWCSSIQGDPDLSWHAELRYGSPTDVLLGAASDASYVVVGSRGLRGEAEQLGSTSHHVVHHAPCPVVVVPHP